MKQRIALLGSTGSIGEQTLDVVRARSDRFEIAVLTACSNWQKLARQAEEFAPDAVVIADERWYGDLREALALSTNRKIFMIKLRRKSTAFLSQGADAFPYSA